MSIERIALDDDRDAWLRTRRNFINASEMATVCGEASYGSLAELFAEKKGLRPPMIDSAVLRRGRWGEAAVFQAIAETYPEWNVRRAKVHCIDRERRIAATPDGFAEASDRPGIGLIETKVVARGVFRSKWLDDASDSIDGPATIPANFRIQTTATRMLNADACEWAVIAVLINSEYDWTFRLFDLEPDPPLEARILYCADAFLRDYLDRDVMPPFDPQRDEQLVKLLHPKDDGSEIDLATDNRALAATEEFVETIAALKRLKDQQNALKTELTAKIGNHTFARLADGRRLSWKSQHRKAYTAPACRFPRAARAERRREGCRMNYEQIKDEPKIYYCAICKTEPVDAEDGFDTCEWCQPRKRRPLSIGSCAIGVLAGFGLAAAFTMVSASVRTPLQPRLAETFALVQTDAPTLSKADKSLAPIRIKTVPVAAAPMPELPPGPAVATAAPEAPADDEDEPLPASKKPHHADDICSRHGGYRVEITVRHGWHSWRCKFAKGGR